MMSKSISRSCAIIACLTIGALVSRPLFAQHHGGGHGGGHHGSSHHGGHHSSWSYVVPSHHHHPGAYYSYGGANYYTPVLPPVQVQVMRPQIDARAAQPVAPQGAPAAPIAPQSAKLVFGGFQRTEDLAGRLEIEANRWCLDMHYNYQHNPDFAVTYGDAYKVLTAAKFMHSAEHIRNRDAIVKEIAAIDPLLHQVQERTNTWTSGDRRPVGDGNLVAKSAGVAAILHHLAYDVGVEPQHSEGSGDEQAPPPAHTVPAPRQAIR